ncbi:MAG: GNAT family N-acetyltransferase [Paracoccaceae bacterium]
MGIVRLRAATPLPGLDALRADARAEGYRHLDRLAASLAEDPGYVERPGHAFFGAMAHGALVGPGGLTPDPSGGPGDGRVRRLYVAPDARGVGHGAALLDAIEAEARTLGLTRLRVRLGNPAAAGFFARFGFEPVDEPEATHAKALR